MVYLSFDLDCLDPAYAPGAANPQPGGLTTRQVLEIMHDIAGLRIVAAGELWLPENCGCRCRRVRSGIRFGRANDSVHFSNSDQGNDGDHGPICLERLSLLLTASLSSSLTASEAIQRAAFSFFRTSSAEVISNLPRSGNCIIWPAMNSTCESEF